MESKRSADRKARIESLDTAFWLRLEQLPRATSPADIEATRSDEGAFAPPAQRAGEILHAVASALSEIPFGEVHGIEIRRITELTLEKDASLDAPIEVRARAIGKRELTAGRQLVTVRCQLTNQFGTVAAFSVETEATTEVPVDSTPLDGTTDSIATTDPDLECVDNMPV
jgi:hypothetical protein